ncbi:MAG: hypothetical protein IT457_01605 [Planctomycetes bacterium]|nr:hypothetical protein [Planctomycetota bacterium]
MLDFLCDLARVTTDGAYVAFARTAGRYLLDVAIPDRAVRKWRNGPGVPGVPVAADDRGHNVDRMLGAAGEALTLLRLLTIDRTFDPVRVMPDRATAPATSA